MFKDQQVRFPSLSILSKVKSHLLPLILGLAIVLLILTIIIALKSDGQKNQDIGNEKITYYKVASIIDGDTIKLENGWTIRYLDIDTPETHSPKVAPQCYGQEASDYNEKLLEGRKVRLVSDVTDKDNYGRLLRYVFTDDGTFVNYELVLKGFAQVSVIPPDSLLYKTFLTAQDSAVKNSLGLWSKCLKNQGG